MIPRDATPTLLELARGFPVVAVTGPRQSGKTTLVRATFGDRPYVSLEDLDRREEATDDPRGFLARFPDGAIFDEVQHCPDLFSYLQGEVDTDPRPGRFILTGSQNFALLARLTQSLAGRVGLFHLLPFSLRELAAVGRAPERLVDLLHTGLYPPLYDREVTAARWYASYVATYVERDVRQLLNVRDLATFHRFVRMCAGRSGQLLNLSGLAADCGITHNTARAWISVLEASYLLFRLPPHHRNFRKRLVKSPKLYFYDPGLAAWLLGIESGEQLATHPMRAPLFEGWVISELHKQRANRAEAAGLSFWRDRSGHEVDLIVEEGDRLRPVEIKSGQTVTADQLAGLHHWLALAGDEAIHPTLIYGGETATTRHTIQILPWRDLDRGEL